MEKDISTEKKIKEAARKVFLEKGYGQARTRDIADEAGINLALLNYYFRSKEKLFGIIMEESMQQMFGLIVSIVNDKAVSLTEKIDIVVNRYIDSLRENPNLPLFVLSEMQANPHIIMDKTGLTDNMISNNYFYKQIQEQIDKKNLTGLSPLHIFINIISMTVFPIVGKPLLISMHSELDLPKYEIFIEERRKLIPTWIKTMLKLDE